MGKIKIIENTGELVIEYKANLFSTNSFLATGIASLIFIIFFYEIPSVTFPIAFLIAILMSVNNKVTIKVKSNLVSITSKFDSWFLKNTVNIPTKDLIQIYVKEQKKIDEPSEYTLYAKQAKGKPTIPFFNKITFNDAKEAQLIEGKIQDFLGIKDFQIHGEYRGKLNKPLRVNTPIRQIKEQNPTQLNIKDLKVGAFLDYELVTWEVVYQTQYDWDRKITEIQYQLSDHKGHSMLVFVQIHEKYPSTWSENKISYHDFETYKLSDILYSPPTELTFKDQSFFRKNIGIGKKFIPNEQEGLQIKQWHYITSDEKQSLRILQYEDKGWAAFSGKKIEEFEFENILTN
jgi:hypothetical protein